MKARQKVSLSIITLGIVALVAFGICHDPASFFFFAAMTFALTLGVALPFLLLGRWGVIRYRGGRSGGRLLVTVASLGLLAIAIGFVDICASSSPFFERIIASGETPDGREYAISQAWVDWFDGYDLQLYIRGKDGEWHIHSGGRDWHPFDRFKVCFPANDAKPVLVLGEGQTRDFEVGRPDLEETLPSAFSADELHLRHKTANLQMRIVNGKNLQSCCRSPGVECRASLRR